MPPSIEKAKARGEAGFGKAAKRDGQQPNYTVSPALRFRIDVIHPVDGRPRLWDHYPTREAAETVASTLRRHGFLVRVDEVAR